MFLKIAKKKVLPLSANESKFHFVLNEFTFDKFFLEIEIFSGVEVLHRTPMCSTCVQELLSLLHFSEPPWNIIPVKSIFQNFSMIFYANI